MEAPQQQSRPRRDRRRRRYGEEEEGVESLAAGVAAVSIAPPPVNNPPRAPAAAAAPPAAAASAAPATPAATSSSAPKAAPKGPPPPVEMPNGPGGPPKRPPKKGRGRGRGRGKGKGNPLTAENLEKHNQASAEVRMFGCRDCSHLFYQKVQKIKPVSHCMRCKQCLQAIPVHEEPAGLGYFRCRHGDCHRTWTSYPAARDVKQPCYACYQQAKPWKVIPSPLLRTDPDQRPRSQTGLAHSCYACKELPKGSKCPLRGRFGFVASKHHDHTGSTITLGDDSKYKRWLTPNALVKHDARMRNHEYDPVSDDSDSESVSSVSTVRSNYSRGGSRGGSSRGGYGRGGGYGGGYGRGGQ